MLPVPLIGPAYESRELPLSAQVTKNLFPQIDQEARTVVSLHSFPGLKPFASGTGTFRGDHVAKGVYYVIGGNTLWSVDSTGTLTNLGAISGSDTCGFANNDQLIMIVTGGDWYKFTIATGVLEVNPDDDLVKPTTVAYLNSQFIFDNNGPTSIDGEFTTTSISGDIDALDFATAESHPDDILRLFIHNQLVYMYGSETFESWYNSGVGRPPFDRLQGGSRNIGIAGKNAVTEQDQLMYFLDNERIPRRMTGYDTAPIGNNAIGKEFNSYSTVSDCRVFSFNLDNQDFVVYTFPIAARTWGYHVPSNSWFELSHGVEGDKWRGCSHQLAYEKHLIADHSNGNIYELDFDTFKNNDEVMQRRRITSVIHSGLYGAPGMTMTFGTVEFVMQVGEGLTEGQGQNPQLMVRHSDDGGLTWSAETWYDLGAGGDYLRRVEDYSGGMAEQRIYELTYTDPTKFTLMSAHGEIGFG